ncbi:MAG: ABC transporter permease subunit [Promethearchaeia archaeon]
MLDQKNKRQVINLKDFLRQHSFFFLLCLLGSVLLLLVVLTIVDMIIKQLILNFSNFISVITEWYVIETILLTFYTSFIATLLAIIFGIPLAYILAKYEFRGKTLVESILNIPLMIPHSVAGLLIYIIFYRNGIIGAPMKNIGIVFEDSIFGIIVALLFVSMPIFINNVKDGFASISPHYENVAASLGANERQVFTHIMLPLTARQIFTGSVMCWARGISEFGAVILIAYYPMIAPVLVYYRFNTTGLEGSGPIALILILMSLAVFLMLYLLKNQPRFSAYGE